MSCGLRVHSGLVLLSSSVSCVVSLTFLVFFCARRNQNRPGRKWRTNLLVLVLVDLLDLGLGLVLLDGLVVINLFLDLLGDDELDGVRDEFGVLLDNVLDPALLEVLVLVLLQEEAHLGAALEGRAVVLLDGEGPARGGLPDVLLVVVVLGDDLDAVRNQEGGVEADTELPDCALC
jgi:hypothetical protein